MNPWQSLRREIDGVVRSIRYDLAAKQAKRALRHDTVSLPPVGQRPGTGRAATGRSLAVARSTFKDRRLLYAATAVVLLPVAGVSGYFAVTGGLNALFPGESYPNGLPVTQPGPRSPSPSPDSPGEVLPVDGGDPARGRPAPRTSPGNPIFVTPVPTPAPTCQCTPPPTPTFTPSAPASMTPSSTPTMTPVPTPAPTRSTAQDGSPSPRLTSRLRP